MNSVTVEHRQTGIGHYLTNVPDDVVNSVHFTPPLGATTSNVICRSWTFRKTCPLTVKKEKIHNR